MCNGDTWGTLRVVLICEGVKTAHADLASRYGGCGSLAMLTVGSKVSLENTSSRMFVVLYR